MLLTTSRGHKTSKVSKSSKKLNIQWKNVQCKWCIATYQYYCYCCDCWVVLKYSLGKRQRMSFLKQNREIHMQSSVKSELPHGRQGLILWWELNHCTQLCSSRRRQTNLKQEYRISSLMYIETEGKQNRK